MSDIRKIIKELDSVEEKGDFSESYHADKLSYAANLIEMLVEESKK